MGVASNSQCIFLLTLGGTELTLFKRFMNME